MTCETGFDCSIILNISDFTLSYSTIPDFLKESAPDSDISGLGVILAFVLTAYVTFLLVVVGYCFGCVPNECLGKLDHRTFRIKPRTSPVWTIVLERVVLMFSDQQIITGIAILAAGYSKRCTISVYHYHVVVYLAWMSSSTHLVTLTVLRNFLRKAPSIRTWRIIGMSALFVMLFVALVPTGATSWFAIALGIIPIWPGPGPTGSAIIPAQCFWTEKYWAGWDSYAVLSYFLLLSNYISRAAALFASSEAFFTKWLREKPGRLLEKALDRSVRYAMVGAQRKFTLRRMPYIVLLATFALALAVYDIYASFFASLIYLLLMLAYGSYQVFFPRRQIPTEMVSSENSWGFGQLIPLLLLALPLLTVLEFHRDAKKEDAGKKDSLIINGGNCDEGNSGTWATETVTQANASPESSSVSITQEAGSRREATSSAEVAMELATITLPDWEYRLLRESDGITPARNGQNREYTGLLAPPTIRFFKSYQQDFYISKWFRGLQLFLVLWVVSIIIFATLTNQGHSEEWRWLGLMEIPALFGVLLLWMLGGIFWSRVFE